MRVREVADPKCRCAGAGRPRWILETPRSPRARTNRFDRGPRALRWASDALLLGRTTYDIFRGYWPGKTDGIGRAFDRVPKYVASRGTPELSWDTSIQITDVGAEVRDLRERHEQIHTWGSANLLQTLFREAGPGHESRHRFVRSAWALGLTGDEVAHTGDGKGEQPTFGGVNEALLDEFVAGH